MIHRWDIATPMNHRCCWLRASATSSAPRCSSPPLPDGMIATLLDEVAAGDLRVVVDRDFPLAEAAKAHAYIENRQMFGRVELIPKPDQQAATVYGAPAPLSGARSSVAV